MDIRRIMETRALHNKTSAAPTGVEPSISFHHVMDQKREQRHHERFERQLIAIQEKGELLAETQTIETLTEYKQMIKEFMRDAVDSALRLDEKRGFNRRGRTKIYKVVEQVDQKLLELTNNVVNGESSRLDLLDRIGEIQGMLVNVYV